MSYWNYANKPYNKEDEAIIYQLTKKSVDLINRYNGEVHFITDSLGKEIFKNIKFASIDTYLDCVPKKYYQIWCLGKMYALNKIANKNEPFIHLDYDFLIFKKIPEYIFKKDIIVQSLEYDLNKFGYAIDYFDKNCINKYYCKNQNLDYAYNCGIIGGQDYVFFNKYSNAAINMITDKENEKFFLKNFDEHLKNYPNFKHWTTSVLSEQYHLANACNFLNKKVTFFYEELAPFTFKRRNRTYCPAEKYFFLESNCIHIYGKYKTDKEFKKYMI